MPSLVQLEYIVAVADLKHFGKAAKSCHVSQPTLSQQIRKVEDSLDIMIFDRIHKPIVLTPEGKYFLHQARLILREHKKLTQLSLQHGTEMAGEFRLGVIPTVANTLVPHFIQRFSQQHPKVTLLIDELKTSTLIQELTEDRLDAALMATPLEIEGLKEEPLYYETFHVYASTGHRLLKEKFCRAQNLDKSDLWLLQDGHCFKDQILQLCPTDLKNDAATPRIQFTGGNLDTLLRLIKQGSGYTLLPAFMTHQMSSNEIKNHVREFQKPYPAREISLVSRRNYWRRNHIAAIKNSILENLPKTLYTKKQNDLKVLDLCQT